MMQHHDERGLGGPHSADQAPHEMINYSHSHTDDESSNVTIDAKYNNKFVESLITKYASGGEGTEKDFDEIHTMKSIQGYKRNLFMTIVFYILCVATLGLLLLVSRWVPQLKLLLTHLPTDLRTADTVLIKSKLGGYITVCTVRSYDVSTGAESGHELRPIFIRMFKYRHTNFIFDEQTAQFKQIHFNTSIPFSQILEQAAGPPPQRAFHQMLFRQNLIDIPVKSYVMLLIDEVLHPFYIFQIISIIIWLSDEYFIYAIAIFFTSSITALISLVDTRRNMVKLASTAKYGCQVNRFNLKDSLIDCDNVNSVELVPGDLIEITDQLTMPCDCVVIQGQVIVNEAMLTGESIPVTKLAVPNNASQIYNIDNDRNYTLYAGTNVLQIRRGGNRIISTEKCVAMVLRTGFACAKGKLMLSILYPKPTTFKFYQDSFKFIAFMFLAGIIGIIASAIQLSRLGVPAWDIIIRALDVITIAVPPALPLAMTVGTTFAIMRLRNFYKIYCISPPRVNVSGQLKLMCFDKTGTLTEEGLDLMGVRVTVENADSLKFGNGIKSESVPTMYSNIIERGTHGMHVREDLDHVEKTSKKLLYCMVSCHGLTHVRGEMVGDPLEMKVFQATKWALKEPENFEDNRLQSPKSDDGIVEKRQYNRIAVPPFMAPSSRTINDDLEAEDTATSNSNAPMQSTDIEYGETRVPPVVLATVKTFDFKSSLQRMSVVVRDIKDELQGGNCDDVYDIYVKGSPEALKKISNPDTIPTDFNKVLNHYAHQGYRVLACAHRRLRLTQQELHKLEREEIECELNFLGLILMQNKVKSDTKQVIEDLNRNHIKSVMVTGDNPLTAISVARQCAMVPKSRVFLGVFVENDLVWNDIDSDDTLDPNTLTPYTNANEPFELAVTGDVFAHLLYQHEQKLSEGAPYIDTVHPSPLHIVLSTSSVFARMTPDEKLRLVEEFIKLGYLVGMCGDGANDCGALKAAHVGVSLSEAEASVAAPFTSIHPTIACIPNVIREGRAALATSFQMFKYMACYSLLQFFTVVCLYQINSNLGDYQFLFVDIVIILPTVLLMCRTEANDKLSRSKPQSSLISRNVFASLAFHLISAFIMQIVIMFDVQHQRFYRYLATAPNTKDNIATYECTALFSLNIFQTFGVAFVYSISRPFKKPLLTNRPYVVVLVLLPVLLSYIVLVPDTVFTSYWLELVEMPMWYKARLYGIGVLYIVVSYLFERWFIVGVLRGALNLFSGRKMSYFYQKYIQRGNPIYRSRKAYNLLADGVKRLREEEKSRRTDSVSLTVDRD